MEASSAAGFPHARAVDGQTLIQRNDRGEVKKTGFFIVKPAGFPNRN